MIKVKYTSLLYAFSAIVLILVQNSLAQETKETLVESNDEYIDQLINPEIPEDTSYFNNDLQKEDDSFLSKIGVLNEVNFISNTEEIVLKKKIPLIQE